MKRSKLRAYLGHIVRYLGHVKIFTAGNVFGKNKHPGQAPGDVNVKLCDQPSLSFDEQGALPDQEIAVTMKRQQGLLLDSLDSDKAFGPTDDRFANCFWVNGIGLAALHIGLNLHRWGRPHIMIQRAQLTRPTEWIAAGFHANRARLQLRKLRRNLRWPQRAIESGGFVFDDAVNQKVILARSRYIMVICMGRFISKSELDTCTMALRHSGRSRSHLLHRPSRTVMQ